MIWVPQVLEALDLSAEEPGSSFLERLFARFNARVPFETVSKILRNAEVAGASEKPRAPQVFWEEHLAWGAGGTCFARVAAFEALLGGLGFRVHKLLGRVEAEGDHAALLVETGRESFLADVGFPLPALLPAREGETDTALATLRLSETPRGFRVEFFGGVPEGPRSLEIFSERVSEGEFAKRWQATFRPESRFLSEVSLRKTEESRAVSFFRGEVRVDDLHSRLTIPLPDSRAARLDEIFGVDRERLTRAFALVGDRGPERGGTELTAYLETDAPPEEAFAAISTSAGYRDLMAGVARVTALEELPNGGWRLEMEAPGQNAELPDARFVEEVAPEAESRRLSVRRLYESRAYDSAFATEERNGRTYLLRKLSLPGAREDFLRNDSARGRLAGTLAVDLLAWARMIGVSSAKITP